MLVAHNAVDLSEGRYRGGARFLLWRRSRPRFIGFVDRFVDDDPFTGNSVENGKQRISDGFLWETA
jgi:hypothetical protein